jgi:NTP pyrophosphatase (non-canonical NTP hydrolase)
MASDGRTLRECQKEVDDWISTTKDGYWNPHQMLTHLSSELGELAKEVNHKFGPLPKKKEEKSSSITEECGDILFTLICLLNDQGLSLDDAYRIAMDKCHGRDKDRFEKK